MRLFVDYNYPDCDPGNSSSAESSEGNSSAYVTNSNNIATMSSCRVSRGTSEPPADYHARTGLRKSGCPFKVSGIVMGSQENLASSDDEKSNDPYAIFGRRIRRSITPVRTAPYQPIKNAGTFTRSTTKDNEESSKTSNNDELMFSTPFGTTQNNNSVGKHSYKTGRKADLSHWGNPRNNQSSGIFDRNNDDQYQTYSSYGQTVTNIQMQQKNEETKSSWISPPSLNHQSVSSIDVEKTIYLDENTGIGIRTDKESNVVEVSKRSTSETQREKSSRSMSLPRQVQSLVCLNPDPRSNHIATEDRFNDNIGGSNKSNQVTVQSSRNSVNLVEDSNVNEVKNETYLSAAEHQSKKNAYTAQFQIKSINNSESEPISQTMKKEENINSSKQVSYCNETQDSAIETFKEKQEELSFDASVSINQTNYQSVKLESCKQLKSETCILSESQLYKEKQSNGLVSQEDFTSKIEKNAKEIQNLNIENVNDQNLAESFKENSNTTQDKTQSKTNNRFMTPDDLPGLATLSRDSTSNRPIPSQFMSSIQNDKTELESVSSICVEETIVLQKPSKCSLNQQGTEAQESRPDTACTMITIGSDVLEVNPEDVKYHCGFTDNEYEPDFYDDVLEVQPHDVSYHEPKEQVSSYFSRNNFVSNNWRRDCKTPTNEFSQANLNLSSLNINEEKSNITKDEEIVSVSDQRNVNESKVMVNEKTFTSINSENRKREDMNKSTTHEETMVSGSEFQTTEINYCTEIRHETKNTINISEETKTIDSTPIKTASQENICKENIDKDVDQSSAYFGLTSGTSGSTLMKEKNSIQNTDLKLSSVEKVCTEDIHSNKSLFMTEVSEDVKQTITDPTNLQTMNTTENSDEAIVKSEFVMCKKEYAKMEQLFDKLIENEGLQFDDFQEMLKSQSEEIDNNEENIAGKLENSYTEDSVVSFLRSGSACNVGDETGLNDGDISSADDKDCDTTCASDTSNSLKAPSIKVKRKRSSKNNDQIIMDESDAEDSAATIISESKRKSSEGKRKSRERRSSLVITPSAVSEKHKAKRRRNRTIDNPESWCATIATYTLKTYTKEELKSDVVRVPHTKEETGVQTHPPTDNESGTEEGLGQGFGIIINKLKNIETKLDELKTIDHVESSNHVSNTLGYDQDNLPVSYEASVKSSTNVASQIGLNVSQLEYANLPNVDASPSFSNIISHNNERDASSLSLDFIMQEDNSQEKQSHDTKDECNTSFSASATDNETNSSSMVHYVYEQKDHKDANSLSNIKEDFRIDKMENEDREDDKEDSDEDRTLIVDEDNVAEHHDDFVTELPTDDEYDRRKCKSTPENVVIQSPSPDFPMRNNPGKENNAETDGSRSKGSQNLNNKSHTLDIVSIPPSDMSDFDDDDLLDEDPDARSSSRASRIEELARKMLEETELKKESSNRTRHPSDPGVKHIMDILGELDTVSERSEIEEDTVINDDSEDSGSLSDSSQTSQALYDKFCKKKEKLREQQRELEKLKEACNRDNSASNPNKGRLRTRSASRERTLGKIKYCWRCHQAGHESYECTVQLNPAAWCPRCLESSHWEDSCWLNDKEVFL